MVPGHDFQNDHGPNAGSSRAACIQHGHIMVGSIRIEACRLRVLCAGHTIEKLVLQRGILRLHSGYIAILLRFFA